MNNILEGSIKAARQAGKEILKIYDRDYKVSEKEDKSPVTEADLVSDKIIIDILNNFDYPILSEESKDDFADFDAPNFWVVDSLDGTMDFIQKTGEFSIMIGLVEAGEPALGVVYKPATNELYYARKGEGAYLDNNGVTKKIKVSDIRDLKEGRLVLSRNHFKPKDKLLADKMKISKFRKSGSNGIKIGLIASNQADLFFNLTDKMGKWDSCAPEAILKEAGGMITDIRGEEINYNERETRNKFGIVASNKFIHSQIIQNINI